MKPETVSANTTTAALNMAISFAEMYVAPRLMPVRTGQSLWPRSLRFVHATQLSPQDAVRPLSRLRGEGWGGGSFGNGICGGNPHPPRVARHPPPQAGEGSIAPPPQ